MNKKFFSLFLFAVLGFFIVALISKGLDGFMSFIGLSGLAWYWYILLALVLGFFVGRKYLVR